MPGSPGAALALLLLDGFQTMVDEVVDGLAARGHPNVRPVHEFALRAIDGGADTASELGRALSVSKQAAAKTVGALQQLGYVELADDPGDGRRKRIRVTPLGHEMTQIGAALFDDVRNGWATQIGKHELNAIEARLRQLIPPRPVRVEDLAGPEGEA